MKKDFLFFNYSWVPNSTFYFKSFETNGYNCDFVDENNIYEFEPVHKYKFVVLYLHEQMLLPRINFLIDNYFEDSILVQHDDTDSEHVNKWSNRSPDFIMQRELTENTKNIYNCPIYPFHFPIRTMYDVTIKKEMDIVFYACLTNNRRLPFINKIVELSNNQLSYLKWDLKITKNGKRTPDSYKKAINSAKIGLHYFGNSYDSWRIWEYASCKTAIIMPKLKMKSVTDDFIKFDEDNYIVIRDDFVDIYDKILYAMDNYIKYSEKAFDEYNSRHIPEKCFEKYHNIFKKYL